MKPYIQLSIRTRSETIDLSIGQKLIDSLCVSEGVLFPERISHNPDMVANTFGEKESYQQFWASKSSMRVNGSPFDFYQDFAWRRKKNIRSVGCVTHTCKNFRGQTVPGSISLTASFSDEVDWYALFKAWCEIFPPQIAMIHLFTDPELSPSVKNGSFQVGSFSAALKPEIPNIGWGMFYGDEYAQEVDVAKIGDSRCHVESIGNGHLVRVTDNIKEVIDDFSFFSSRRSNLKKIFREGLFLINHEPSI